MSNILSFDPNLLLDLLKSNSPSGNEDEIISFVRNQMQPYCPSRTDVMGNLFMHVGPQHCNKIMLTAHCDEVGFQITSIDKDGYIYVRKLGGLDRHTLPGTKVVILTDTGHIHGVFGKKSPHVQNESERSKVLELENLWIDCGFISQEEASACISIGDYVTAFDQPLLTHGDRCVVSKGLDNKVSVFILMETLKRLSQHPLTTQVVGVITTQEEIGCRGAIVAAQQEKPQLAFCLDVGIATDIPSMDTKTYGDFKLGHGPGICKNPDNNAILMKKLAQIATQNDIQHQLIAGFRATGGTETARIQLTTNGVITANISLPNRYMHSVVEMCSLADIDSTIQLLTSSILDLQGFDPDDFNLFSS